VVAMDVASETADLGQRREVGLVEAGGALAFGGDRGDHGLAALRVAAVDDHVRAVGGQPAGHFAAEAVGGAGNEGDALSGGSQALGAVRLGITPVPARVFAASGIAVSCAHDAT
jgi:hypothetical protein